LDSIELPPGEDFGIKRYVGPITAADF
jgi:hypothetical protein